MNYATHAVAAASRSRAGDACELAGVGPWFEVDETLIDEDEITAYIWDANGDRRNLSKGQRAMLAALRPGASRSLSEQTNVALGYVAKARQVIQC